ncbi:beta-N-acetylglucosaminidase domain-containing protein, partial [Actinomyces trachealis]|uniref:beta-N-acetylglucosaminidase domain-containing protein n=1 Tax=Actinomyces trachealis TaxID=2763540 RepID=UPI001892CBAF
MHAPFRKGGAIATVMLAGVLALSGVATAIATPLPAAPAAPTNPQILPVPHEVTWGSTDVALNGKVAIIPTDASPDPQTLADLQALVTAAGGTVTQDAAAASARIVVGTDDGTASGHALLPAGITTPQQNDGYTVTTLASPVPTVVALGNDVEGAYYAVQTLRQMRVGGRIKGGTVSDWPLMSIRGAIEGFYGIPWSHQARLDLMRFYGEHKMNTYVYTPKDDRYLRARWRDLYPATELAKLKELVDAANQHHVSFVFALSPGNDVCYGSQADYDATIAKLNQLHSIGVSQFYIALDDIKPQLNCASDFTQFPPHGPWTQLADAQSYYLNRLQREYLKANNLPDLWFVPTNYNGNNPDPFKTAQGARLDPDIRLQWTGMGVFAQEITLEQVTKAATTYNTKHLFIWDNFPVNDNPSNRLFLGPLTGRDPDLYQKIDGFTSNPMVQPYASMLALASYGDYTWNGPAFNHDDSWMAALKEIVGADSGKVWETMLAFTDLNQYWPYSSTSPHAPALSADISALETALAGSDQAALTAASDHLHARLALIKDAPETLKDIKIKGFYEDTEGFIKAAADWAVATEKALETRMALRRGDAEAATRGVIAMHEAIASANQPRLATIDGNFQIVPNSKVPAVGDGVFNTFTSTADNAWSDWAALANVGGEKIPVVSASTSIGEYQSIDNMIDDRPDTFWWSNAPGNTGATVTVDLGSVKDVGSVKVEQGRTADDHGDKFYHAVLEVSSDQSTWTSLGEFHNQGTLRGTAPVGAKARWVRVRSIGDNPGGQWVQIRNFEVHAPSGEQSTNLPLAAGSSLSDAMDGSSATAMVAASVPADGIVSTGFAKVTDSNVDVVVVGTVAAQVQVADINGAWTDLGRTDATRAWNAFTTSGPIKGIRLVEIAAEPLPSVVELGYRPASATPPAPVPTPAPTSTPEPVPTGTGVPVPEPVVMPAYVAKVQASSSGLVLKG